MHAERLAADLAGQVERRLWQAMPCQFQSIGGYARLQRATHLRRGPEEPIRWRQAVDPLMRALEVVVVDEQPDPSLSVAHVHEDCALDALAPQGAPEAFDLAQRLRPTWRGHDLFDATLFQFAREGALATPGHVLTAVIGQDLFGHAIGCERCSEDLDDQCRGLTGVQTVAHDVAAVVVHEG